MHRGSCLCGAIKYEIKGDLDRMIYCHCQMCRKASGTAFATNAPVDAASFRFVTGEDALAEYESSPGKHRCFCSRCGSPIYSKNNSRPGILRLRVGTLDPAIAERPTAHFFVSSKAEWFEIHDDLPRFDEVR